MMKMNALMSDEAELIGIDKKSLNNLYKFSNEFERF